MKVFMEFRIATNKDTLVIKDIVFSTLQEYGLAPDPGATDTDIDDVENSYFRNGGYFELSEVEGIPVGTWGLFPIDDSSCELRKMYLRQSARGRGLGKKMMERALKKARDLGFKRIELETASVLKEAIRMYEQYGFKPVRRSHLASRCDQAYELWLEPQINSNPISNEDSIGIFQAVEEWKVRYPNPIKLKKGDHLTIEKREVDSDWMGWIYCIDENGVGGWVPESSLAITHNKAIAVRAYDATELTLRVDQIVRGHLTESGWLWAENSFGEKGWVPLRNLKKSDTGVFIRKAMAKDLHAIAAMLQELGYPQTNFDELKNVFDLIQNQKDQLVLIAEDNEGTSGFISCTIKPQLRLCGSSLEIDELCVLTEKRGTGIGKSLLNEVKVFAQSSNCKRMVLSTNKKRDSYERGFYSKNGFIQTDSALMKLNISDLW
jgi:putative acetyltransferase